MIEDGEFLITTTNEYPAFADRHNFHDEEPTNLSSGSDSGQTQVIEAPKGNSPIKEEQQEFRFETKSGQEEFDLKLLQE